MCWCLSIIKQLLYSGKNMSLVSLSVSTQIRDRISDRTINHADQELIKRSVGKGSHFNANTAICSQIVKCMKHVRNVESNSQLNINFNLRGEIGYYVHNVSLLRVNPCRIRQRQPCEEGPLASLACLIPNSESHQWVPFHLVVLLAPLY